MTKRKTICATKKTSRIVKLTQQPEMTHFQPVPFGKYVLLEKVGVEPIAELFRARAAESGDQEKSVLIKKFLPQFMADQGFVNAMKQAAGISANIHHPNIVQVLDFEISENASYIATEYLSGRTLQEILTAMQANGQPMAVPCALYITEEICKGLKHAHGLADSQGDPCHIVHNNINPQSIFITQKGGIKITDFGGAAAQSPDNNSQIGMFKGKVAYMSPEQVDGKAIDCRSDLFSLGIILYEMATGRRPFDGETVQVFSRVRQARFEPPEKIVPGLSPALCQVIGCALQRDPENRYPSAGDMLAALEQVLFNMATLPGTATVARYVEDLFPEKPVVDTGFHHEASDAPHRERVPNTSHSAPQETVVTENARHVKGAQNGEAALPESNNKAKSLVRKYPLSEPASGPAKAPADFSKNDRVSTAPVNPIAAPVQTSSPPHTRAMQASAPNPSLRRLALWSAIAATVVISFIGFALVSNLHQHWSNDRPNTMEHSGASNGIKALQAGRFDLAVSLFSQVLADDPAMTSTISDVYAEALEGQAKELLTTDLKKAEAALVQAITLDPRRVSALCRLGLVYLRQNALVHAAESYETAVRLGADAPDALFNLGYIYAVQKDYTKAENMYARVVELAPSFLDEALFNLAMVQDKLGKRTQSAKNLELALKANPKNTQARQYLKKLSG